MLRKFCQQNVFFWKEVLSTFFIISIYIFFPWNCFPPFLLTQAKERVLITSRSYTLVGFLYQLLELFWEKKLNEFRLLEFYSPLFYFLVTVFKEREYGMQACCSLGTWHMYVLHLLLELMANSTEHFALSTLSIDVYF